MNNSMSKTRTAIIGFGAIAQTHVAAIREGSASEITAICDNNPEKLDAAQKAIPGVNLYSDYNAMLDEHVADVIHICTPHYLHMAMAVKSLVAGCDVYLEKPAGMDVAEIQSIIAAADKSGRKVCVSFQNRVIPSNLAAKSILLSGELGPIRGLKGIVTWHREGDYYTKSSWRGTWEREGGGVLMNQSIHTLDLLCFLGGPIRKVEGTATLRTNRGTIEVEDTAEATIYYENGAVGVFYATNCFSADSPVEMEIVCEKGSLIIRDDMLYKKIGAEINLVAENNGVVVGKGYWGAGHLTMIRNFYFALQGGSNYYCDIREALPSMRAIESIYKSNRKTLVEGP